LRQNLAIAPDCARAKFRAQLAKLYLAKFLAQFVLRLPSLAGSLAVTNDFDREELQYFISMRHDTSNKIYGTELIPGNMLAPSYKNVLITEEVKQILCEWYATLYKRKKKDVKVYMDVTMNQYARLSIGNEIFGSKIAGRHENNAIILAK
jgi:hypothetical protein